MQLFHNVVNEQSLPSFVTSHLDKALCKIISQQICSNQSNFSGSNFSNYIKLKKISRVLTINVSMNYESAHIIASLLSLSDIETISYLWCQVLFDPHHTRLNIIIQQKKSCCSHYKSLKQLCVCMIVANYITSAISVQQSLALYSFSPIH